MNYGNTGGNPPWARQSGGGGFNFNAGNPFPGQPHLTQPALALPTSLSGVVSAASNLPSRPANQQSSAAINTSPRVFTGTITKVSDNFGFVDEDVFFQTSVCKGGTPKLGDRVLVEASYNANMPFKWNATRIQLIPNVGAAIQQPQTLRPAVAAVQQISALQQAHLTGSPIAPVFRQGGLNIQQLQQMASHQHHHGHGRFAPSAHLNKPTLQQGRPSRFDQRDRRDERRERPRTPPRRRSRSPPPRRRSRSPKPKSRSRSPPRRKQKVAPRYSVTISPHSLDMKTCAVLDVRSRYSNMYIPSDFFHLSMDWGTAFPLHRPFSLGNATKFHICHKEVAPLQPFPESVDPADADYSYSAKVMLLAQPSINEIYKMCCSLTEEEKEGDFIHPARVLQFLVGMRSKNEPMAIGGPWSPSLDGADPAGDPQVLVNTATRTTKALTGVDLSACTQWYRFVDISYLRAEEVRKSKTIPEHTEHVVIFLPDVCSVVPTMMDYLSLQASYKRSLLVQLGLEEPEEKPSLQTDAEATAAETSQSQPAVDEEEEAVDASDIADKPEPSHWSKLDPKTMKVVDLRAELEARGVSCKGLKTLLQSKLTKLLTAEMEKEEEGGSQPVVVEVKDEIEEVEKVAEPVQEEVVEPVVELSEEEKAKKEKELEKIKAQLEKHYVFPEDPVILVHPNRSAKSGKFDCSVMSLSVLLDYRPEDNKEHSFEVSLFAESFNEMLMRDFGFTIYKRLSAVPVKKEPKAEESAAADKQEVSKVTDEDKSNIKKEESKDIKDDKLKSGTKRKRSTEPEPVKKRREDDDEDDRSSMSSGTAERSERRSTGSKKVEVDKRKLVTVDRAALLAFVYYDTTHTGYVLDKDVEDMIYTLGLKVSRAQVRTLLQRVCDGKDNITYRKLTDKPEGQSEAPDVQMDEKVDVERLAQGNHEQPGDSKASNTKETVTTDGVVMYRGAIVELDKVMGKLERSEVSRILVEKEMKNVQEERDSLSGKLSKSEERNRKLASDLKKTSDKLVLTKSERNQKEEQLSGLRDALGTASKDLHAVVKLVDGCLATEVEDTPDAVDQEPVQEPATTEGNDDSKQQDSAEQINGADAINCEIKNEAT